MATRHRISAGKRAEIFNQTNGACYYCGYAATTIDHLVPYSFNGNNSELNLVAACSICNSIASNKHFDSLQAKKDYILAERQTLRWSRRIARMNVEKASGDPIVVRGRGSPKTTFITTKPLRDLVDRFGFKGVLTYRELASRLSAMTGEKVGIGTLHRLAHGIEPVTPKLRRALKLPMRDELLLELLGILWGGKR